MKEVFAEVGPVVSFRLVYDRDSGKPKGYGFCEYNDKETALSAMRNLNNYELNGRNLRVDNAANEKNRDEAERRNVQQQQQPQQQAPPIAPSGMPMGPMAPQFDSPYGAECEPQEAPEIISRAVANLPPEQMFELASQMKQCIETNPNEARNMLMQNPQLAFALLQALVVMKIIDPQIASSMLHRPPTTTLVMPSAEAPQPWAQNFPTGGVPPVADPRLRPNSGPVDPRFAAHGQGMRQPPHQSGGPAPSVSEQQDRAQLVMQLMQLSEEQISLLNPDQQRSIRELKAQMNR